MKRVLLALLAAVVGATVSRKTGSRPEVDAADSPLAPCGPHPNCARVSRALHADAERARTIAEAVVRTDRSFLTGASDEVSLTAGGLRATFKIGPFVDDLALEVTPGADDSQCVLHLRSASRVGHNDGGVNRRRVERIVAEVRRRLGA